LLKTRREQIVPHLAGVRFGAATFSSDVLTAHWRLDDGRGLSLVANLSERQAKHAAPAKPAHPIWGGDPREKLPAWSVHWSIGDA
jgi:maltooligosyltrehalose trehalohydrolase